MDAERLEDRYVGRAEEEGRLGGRAVLVLHPGPVRNGQAVALLPLELLIAHDGPAAPADHVEHYAGVGPTRTGESARAQHLGVAADRGEHGAAGHGVVVFDRRAAVALVKLGQLAERRFRSVPRVDQERRGSVVDARADGPNDAGAEPLEGLAARPGTGLDLMGERL